MTPDIETNRNKAISSEEENDLWANDCRWKS